MKPDSWQRSQNVLTGELRPGSKQTATIFYVFDPKFLKSTKLFAKAVSCGVITGGLLPANWRTLLSLEQIYINDKVGAIEYPDGCNSPEFRDYITYRFVMTAYDSQPASGCGVNGTAPPTDQNDPLPCIGDVDIRFGTTIVTSQTSTHSKNWIDMLTDEVSPAVSQGSLESGLLCG